MSRFNAFAQAYLIKSGSKTTPYKVGGIITTEDKDIDGEILKSIDWDYFTGGFGKIKYEHNEIKGPDAVIGFPTKLMKKGRQTHFEGELIAFDPTLPDNKLSPQQRLAKSTVSLLEHINEHNTRHPNNPQKAGWSVEGEYLEKDKRSGLVKARISDVVFTTKPRNKHTVAHILKSLETGYGMSPDTQTGFGATREESLEGTTKNYSSKGDTIMKTKEDVYKECLQKGMSPEEAAKKAEEFESQRVQNLDSKHDMAEKSLASTKTALQKSLDAAKSTLELEIDTDIDGTKKRIQKSLRTNDEGEIDDIGNFLVEVQNTVLKSMEATEVLGAKVDFLAKSLEARAEADISKLDNTEYMQTAVNETNNQIVSLRKGLAVLTRGLGKSLGFIPSEKLQSTQFEENDSPGEKGLTKSQTVNVLDKLAEAEVIDPIEVIKFESTGIISKSIEGLVAAKGKELYK